MRHIFPDAIQLSRAAAEWFTQVARQAVQKVGRFTVALTGGSSPKQLYELLTQEPFRSEVPWEQTYVFWGDERWVPHDDPRNNARMAYEILLDHVPVPADQIFRMSGELPPPESAQQYEALLKEHFGSRPPQFDLILLGMGDDGHTASLFPGTPVLHEKEHWVKEVLLSGQDMYRITLTAPFINQARQIGFLVFGENKALTLREVLEGTYQPDQYPSQLIAPSDGALHWFVDTAAAARLSEKLQG